MGGIGSGRRRIELVPGSPAAGRLLQAIKDSGMTLSDFAKAAEMDPPALHKLLTDPDPNPTLRVLRRLAAASGLSLDIWLEQRQRHRRPRPD